jgi:hypothetical protein
MSYYFDSGGLMETKLTENEQKEINEIDLKLLKLRHTYEGFLPVYHSIDRKVQGLQLEIRCLEEQRLRITECQLVFDSSF